MRFIVTPRPDGYGLIRYDDGEGSLLLDDGTWMPFSGYDVWPTHSADVATDRVKR